MKRSKWLGGLHAVLRGSPRLPHAQSKRRLAATRRASFEPLEARHLLAVLTVNSALDNVTAGDGLVTLREAIIAANTNAMTDLGQTGSGADTIEFDAAAFATPKTIPLTFGELILTEPLTINGPGRDVLTIDARQTSRIFNITATSGDFTIRGLTLTGGKASDVGGAVRNLARLTLADSTVTGNSAAGHGGGLYSKFVLALTNSTISNNRITGTAGSGGGVYATAFAVTDSVISGNSATGSGGGFAGVQGIDKLPILLNSSIIEGNTASGSGGGFSVKGGIVINSSTIRDNMSGGDGGGFDFVPPPFLETTGNLLTIKDSTISENTAAGSGGGFHGAKFVDVTNSSITENKAQENGGGFYAPAQIISSLYLSGTVKLENTTVSGNEASVGGGFWAGYKSELVNCLITENVGGGIFSQFGGELDACTVTHNTASGSGGGIISTGGIQGVRRELRSADLELVSSLVSGNTSSGSGGGIYVGGRATLTNSTVSNNTAGASGGGIAIKTIYSATRSGYFVIGTATLNSSTISDNQSQGTGGGIDARRVILDSSTISSNRGSIGGGVYSHNDATISDSTITGNVAFNGITGGLWNGDNQSFPGRTYTDPSVVVIERSIIAGNTASAGSPDLRPGGGTLTVTSSLIGDNAGSTLAEAQMFNAQGNLIGSAAGGGVIDPRLAPLANNGGPTQTHALLPDSPAIDAIEYYVSGPVPQHDYQLNGTFTDFVGGPNIVALGGTLTATGYNFGPNQGLNRSSPAINAAEYSLEIRFQWTVLSGGWQKIVDFHNLTSDVGLYTAGNGLHFLNTALTTGLFTANTGYSLVLTRDDATDIVRAYLNGSEVWSFVDSANAAVFDGPGKIIRFFQDDTATGQTQAQSGVIDWIRIYEEVLSPTQVSAIYNIPTADLPLYDQRVAPFARVKDGDGIGGPQADMGAFELQGLPVSIDWGDCAGRLGWYPSRQLPYVGGRQRPEPHDCGRARPWGKCRRG